MTHSELEALLQVEGRELLRRLFQAHVDERSPGIAAEPVLDAEGHPCLPQRCHTRHLMTLFGEVEIVRMGYGGPSGSRTRWLRIMVRALSPPGGVACLSQRSALARGFQGPLPACEPASEPMATALCMPINRCLS
jgi:hypothetical protein